MTEAFDFDRLINEPAEPNVEPVMPDQGFDFDALINAPEPQQPQQSADFDFDSLIAEEPAPAPSPESQQFQRRIAPVKPVVEEPTQKPTGTVQEQLIGRIRGLREQIQRVGIDTPEGQKLRTQQEDLLRRYQQGPTEADVRAEEAKVKPIQTMYLGYKGFLSGSTLGASDVVLRAIEDKLGGPITAETTAQSLNQAVGTLIGAVMMGKQIAPKIQSLVGRFGIQGTKALFAIRGGTALAQSIPMQTARVVTGEETAGDAALNVLQGIGSSMVGATPDSFMRAGVGKMFTALAADLSFDAITDAFRGRLTRENAQDWMIQELPNLAATLMFEANDVVARNRTKSEAVQRLQSQVDEAAKRVPTAADVADAELQRRMAGMTPEERAETEAFLESAVPEPRPVTPEGVPTRRFPERVAETSPTAKAAIDRTDISKVVMTDAEALKTAEAEIQADRGKVLQEVLDPNSAVEPIMFTKAQLLLNDAVQRNDINEITTIIDAWSPKATLAGQAIQKLTLWNKLTPQGMLGYLNRQVEKLNRTMGTKVKLTDQDVESILDHMRKANNAHAAGDERGGVRENALAMKVFLDKVPRTKAQKLSMAQTLAQLLNPKTIDRNVIGNQAFASIDNVSKSLQVVFDQLIGVKTGKRTTSLPSLTTQWEGFKKGFVEAVDDVMLGIDTRNVMETKLDIKGAKKFGNNYAEKALRFALEVPDRAAFTAEYQDSLRRQMKAAGVDKPTAAMVDQATKDGLYVTFQDDTVLSNVFQNLKRTMNKLTSPITGTEDFGLGDILLKYPRTPANLLARGIDYSPFGLTKSLLDLASPLFGKSMNQYKTSAGLARGTVGTGIWAGAYLLSSLGILTGAGTEDRDKESLERTIGAGKYRINLSALKRFVASGFNREAAKRQTGDLITSYDWAQPVAFPVGGGASVGEATQLTYNDVLGMVANAMESSTKTLTEQPLMTGIRRAAMSDNPVEALANAALEAPASFVPTLLYQMRQFGDTAVRDTRERNKLKQSINQTINKFPVVSASLPQRADVTGRPMTMFKNQSDLKRFLNVFFNPAFADRYREEPGTKLVLDLYERSGGETRQFPRELARVANITVYGRKIPLDQKERNRLQELVGQKTMDGLNALAQREWSRTANPEDVAKYIDNNILDDAREDAVSQLVSEIGEENVKNRIRKMGFEPKPQGRTSRRRSRR